MSKYVWGVDVGGTSVKLGFLTEEGKLLEEYEIPTRKEDEGKNILPDIGESIEGYLRDHNISREEVIGVGLAVPGPVDSDGVVHKAVNLGWGVFDIEEALSEIISMPVAALNDANAAAAGEVWQGAAKGKKSAFIVTLGTGVGGGAYTEEGLLTGHNGGAGEVGHIHVEDSETRACSCGNKGCVEQYASATGIVNMTVKALENSEIFSTLRTYGDLTPKEVFECAAGGDALACDIVERFGRYLGKAIGTVITLMEPEVVVIGGGVSKAGRILTDTVDKYYKDYTFHVGKDVPVVLADLGNRAGIYGAAMTAIKKIRG